MTTAGAPSGATTTVASPDNGLNQPVPFELSTNGALVETVPQTPSLYDANPSASVSIFGTPIPQLRPSSLQRALEAEGEALDRPVLPLVEIDASALAWIKCVIVMGNLLCRRCCRRVSLTPCLPKVDWNYQQARSRT